MFPSRSPLITPSTLPPLPYTSSSPSHLLLHVPSVGGLSGRCSHSANSFTYEGSPAVVIFGGGRQDWSQDSPLPDGSRGVSVWTHFNDVHLLHGSDLSLLPLLPSPSSSPLPPPRRGHSSFLFHDRYLVIFGGVDDKTLYNDLWRFDISSRTWTPLLQTGTVPSPRRAAVCFQHSLHNRPNCDYAFVYGGEWYESPQENAHTCYKFKFDPLEGKVKWIAASLVMWRHLKAAASPDGYSGTSAFNFLLVGASFSLLRPSANAPPRLYMFGGVNRRTSLPNFHVISIDFVYRDKAEDEDKFHPCT